MITAELQQYVSKMRVLGESEIKIRETLALAKWPQEDINKVLGSPVPISPIVPPSIMPQVQSSGNKTNKKLIFIILGLVIFFLLISVIAGLFVKKNKSNIIVADLNKGGKNPALTIFEDLSKYDKDTDGDGYPDFIETAVGLNPNESELKRCVGAGGCKDPSLTNNGPSRKNVVIILDSSGSMGLTISGQTRMDAAKSAITGYVSQASADKSISIGLMVYGNKGSNSTSDKATSCASAEVIAPLGSVNSSTIGTYLANVKPTGWTPMGLAISNAQSLFPSGTDNKNEIILVTDGDETCNSNPIGAASAIYNSPVKVIVNVIGFAVSIADQTTLNGIASSGGGSFSVANTSSELLRVLNEKFENLSKITEKSKCDLAVYETFLPCENGHFNKVFDYVTKRRSTYYKKEISKAEWNKLNLLYDKIWPLHSDRVKKGVNASQ